MIKYQGNGGILLKNIKILFMGTPEIAKCMLETLYTNGYEISAVVTQPDKKAGRKQQLKCSEVKQFALEHDIDVIQPISIAKEYESLMNIECDLIVTCAYGQFIPEALLQYPKYGSINVHASLLPKLRGGAPIHKAIIYGEKETGISIMRMVKRMDAGAVMAQSSLTIGEDETMGELYDRLTICGQALLLESVEKLVNGEAIFVEQDEAQATFAYAITKEEEHVDFHRDVQEVYNHIRGLIPWPTGYAMIQGKKYKFHKAKMLRKAHNEVAGKVIGLDKDALLVTALNGYILIEEIQMEGKGKMAAKPFFNGAGKQLVGACFE